MVFLFFAGNCLAQDRKAPVFYRQATVYVAQVGNFRVFTIEMLPLPHGDKRRGMVLVYYNAATKKETRSYPIWNEEAGDILVALDYIGKTQNNAEVSDYEDDFNLTSIEGCKFLARKDPHATGFKAAVQLTNFLIPVTFKELGEIRSLIAQAAEKLKENTRK